MLQASVAAALGALPKVGVSGAVLLLETIAEREIKFVRKAAMIESLRESATLMEPPKDILVALREFLIAQGQHRIQQQCSTCGSDMRYLEGLFWIIDTEAKWQISLPFCPQCEPALFEQLPASQTLQ